MGITKAESAGRNLDPLATLWRGLAVCGHCGGRLGTAPASKGQGRRRYVCRSIRGAQGDDETGATRHVCPGGNYSIDASVLDPAGWADVRAWLSDADNVARFLAEWEQDNKSGEQSISSRVEAADAQLALIRSKMRGLAESITDATSREGRLVLQQKLDEYGERLLTEEGKRERLLHEAREASAYAEASQGVRDWVHIVAPRAATMTRAQQPDTLPAPRPRPTPSRSNYVHPERLATAVQDHAALHRLQRPAHNAPSGSLSAHRDVSILMVVLLPAPLGPTRPKTSPRCTSSERALTAVKLPKRRARPSKQPRHLIDGDRTY